MIFNQYNQPFGIALVCSIDTGILVACYSLRLGLIAAERFVVLATKIEQNLGGFDEVLETI